MSPPTSTPAPQAPTSQEPCRSEEKEHLSPDLLSAAQILHERGWSEAAAECALDTFRAQGVVGLRRRVSRMSVAQDRQFRAVFTREAKAHRKNKRGDIMSLRSAPRWPWRVAT